MLSFDPIGGTDLQKERCPQLVIELTESAKSLTKGVWVKHEAGAVVTLTVSQTALKADIITANVIPNDEVLIVLESLKKTNTGGTAKLFSTKVRRTDGPRPAPGQVVTPPPAQGSFGGGAQQSFGGGYEGQAPF